MKYIYVFYFLEFVFRNVFFCITELFFQNKVLIFLILF